ALISGRDAGQVEAGRERRVPERREGPIAIAAGVVAVRHGPTAGRDHAAAGPGQDMVAGGRVPFHGRPAAHVYIGLAGGDEAEFQGRGGGPTGADRERRETLLG